MLVPKSPLKFGSIVHMTEWGWWAWWEWWKQE